MADDAPRRGSAAIATSFWMSVLPGTSTPTSCCFTSRFLASIVTGSATFCATNPRFCASFGIDLRVL
jgi:hypothetical protein